LGLIKGRAEGGKGEREQKQSKNPEKEITHGEKKREEEPTQKTKEKPRKPEQSTQKNTESRTKTQGEGKQRKK
jgi:hypothetical protein